MTIPFSSSLPDAVQKSLGLSGGAGDIEKLIVGALVCLAGCWGLLTVVKKLRGEKRP